MKPRNSEEASLFINAAIHSHIHLWEKMEETEGYLVDCEPPFDDDDLEKDGQSWRNNWNYQRGKSQIEQGVINNATDVFKSFAFIDIEFNKYDEKRHKDPIYGFLVDKSIQNIFRRAISHAFIDVLEEDERTHAWVSAIEYYSFTFGYCPIIRDDFSYLGDPVPLTDIAFEDRTKVGEIRNFVVFDVVKVSFLYQKYLESKNQEGEKIEYLGEEYTILPNGYIKEGLFDIIKQKIDALQLNTKYKPDKEGERLKIVNWENVEDVVDRKGLTYLDYNTGNVFLGKIFNLQEDGKTITETYIVLDSAPRLQTVTTKSYASCRQQLLFQKNHQKRVSQIVNLVKEYGITKDLYIHELKGAGKYIVEDALRYDIKRNHIEDKLLISGAPFFQSNNSLTSKQSQIKVIGGFNIVGDDIQMLPNQVRYDLKDHVESLRLDDETYKETVFHYNPKLNLSSRPTTDEVTLRGSEVNAQKRSKIPIKLADYSRIFTLALIDLANLDFDNVENKYNQQKFFDYIDEHIALYGIVLDRKQIKKIISEVKHIKLNPANGDVQAIREAMQMASSSEYRKNLSVMYLLGLGFSRKDAWNYVEIEDFGSHVDRAASENTMFYDTAEVPVGTHQDSITHLNLHFAKADRVMKGVAGGEDPVKAFNWMTNMLVNTAKHIEIIQTNPFFKNQLKSFLKIQEYFTKKAKQLSDLVNQMKQQMTQDAAAQQQGQQQQQQQADPKTQAQIYNDRIKMLDKIERSKILVEQRKQERTEMMQFSQQLERERFQGQMQLQREMAEMQKEITLLKESAKLATA